MDPDALQNSQRKKHENQEGAAVADQWKRHSGDWSDRNRHSDIHIDVREQQSDDCDDYQSTQIVRGRCGN